MRRKMLYQQLYFGYMLGDSEYINWMFDRDAMMASLSLLKPWGVEAAREYMYLEIHDYHGCLDSGVEI